VTVSSIENLDGAKREIQQQISTKADEIVAEFSSQVLATKDMLLAELDTSVSASKKTLESQKSDVEMQLANIENLSVLAHSIVASEPNLGVEISKEFLSKLQNSSEADYVAPTRSTQVYEPVFISSKYKLTEQNLIGTLDKSKIR
jgi:hypothetical protein